jgi:beta propeller repeat protein
MYDLVTNTERQISVDNSFQVNPKISGDKIVYEDNRNSRDIYLYDLTNQTETRITTDLSHQFSPDISGSKIVWYDIRNGNADIYVYDLTTQMESRVTNNLADQYAPAISGDKVIWIDQRDGNYDVYMYDFSSQTESPISINNESAGGAHRPSISGDKIVYVDNKNGTFNDLDIYLYDIATQTSSKIITNSAKQAHPVINNDKIVWQDYRNENSDIYMYNLEENASPVARMRSLSLTAQGNKRVFDGSLSNDSDGIIMGYSWDFGDGTIAEGVRMSHTYATAGSYQVTLTVTDDEGATDTANMEVLVNVSQ